MTKDNRKKRTLQSLTGLSVGDGFGERFFALPFGAIKRRQLPEGPWGWTDDTHMAISVVDVLLTFGRIEEDELASRFAQRYIEAPWRGYGPGAHHLLKRYAEGHRWQDEAPRVFPGGSYGNGGAMRAAPIGAYFAGDPERSAIEAQRAAKVTHFHPEGRAGAMAVAAAAAIMSSENPPTGTAFLKATLPHFPDTRTKEGVEKALSIDASEHAHAVRELGTGERITAFDTVPYCLWIAAHHGQDFETAMWKTVEGLGDRDTTCAIVGGIIGASVPIPEEWMARTEPLPEEFAL